VRLFVNTLRTSKRFKQVLSRKVMEKGEKAAEFEGEDGVNMTGESMKSWKGKKEMQDLIKRWRLKCFMQ
jgi:hypothetical protein